MLNTFIRHFLSVDQVTYDDEKADENMTDAQYAASIFYDEVYGGESEHEAEEEEAERSHEHSPERDSPFLVGKPKLKVIGSVSSQLKKRKKKKKKKASFNVDDAESGVRDISLHRDKGTLSCLYSKSQ